MTKIIEKHFDENGYYHREDGPALIYPDGTQYWLHHGKLHREDGPALIRPDGRQYWYYHGTRITNKVHQWAKERNIDIDNMVLKFDMAGFVK